MSGGIGAEHPGLTGRLIGAAYNAAWGSLAAIAQPLAAASPHKWREKLGIYPQRDRKPHCWIHGCSLGEVGIAMQCLRALRDRRGDLSFTLSAVTPEGHAAAMAHADTGAVDAVFFPFDARTAMRRAFDRLRPDFIVLCEVELWPNHLREAARRRIPVFVVNGRLTDADERNYRRAGDFMRRAFAIPDLVCARGPVEAARFTRLGARNVVVPGDMKYDALAAASGKREENILLGASTHRGEEEILLGVFSRLRTLFPRLRMVVVPRHPVRAKQIRRLARKQGFDTGLSSRHDTAKDVLVVDQVGRLGAWYARATVCFVGKSLTVRGGQNFLEAAAAGCPVVTGPHLQNFAEAAGLFLGEDAMVQVHNTAGLHAALLRLLRDESARDRLRSRAHDVLQSRRGATDRTADLIIARTPAAS